jgi:hypothetical protein
MNCVPFTSAAKSPPQIARCVSFFRTPDIPRDGLESLGRHRLALMATFASAATPQSFRSSMGPVKGGKHGFRLEEFSAFRTLHP